MSSSYFTNEGCIIEEIIEVADVEKLILEALPLIKEQNRGGIIRVTNHSIRYHMKRTLKMELSPGAVKYALINLSHKKELVRVDSSPSSNIQYLLPSCKGKANIIRK